VKALSSFALAGSPFGKMVFTVLGAVAELERSLIVERVKAGLRNARAKGKHLGRPRKIVVTCRITTPLARGLSLRSIAAKLGVKFATLHLASVPSSKTLEREFGGR